MKDMITVVMPLYNKAAYVERAIRSALSQGDAVREVVVVDDGSYDGSAEIVEAMRDTKVRLVRQPNGGPSRARNRGVHEAQSEYVAFLDADDVYLPGFIDEIIALIHKFPQAVLYATSYTLVWPDGRRLDAIPPRGIKRDVAQIVDQFFSVFSRSSFFSISSSGCVRRQFLIDENILFPEGENVGEDQDVIFRIAEKWPIAFSPKHLAEYTKGIENSLYSSLPDSLPPNSERLAQRLRAGRIPKHHRRGVRRLLSVYCLNIARINLDRRQRAKGLRLLLRHEAYFHLIYWLRTAARFVLPAWIFRNRWTQRI